MSLLPPRSRFALITGATSGIGNGFAHVLAQDGINLVIIARDGTRLKEVKNELEARYSIKVKIIPKDLANPEASSEIFEILKQEGIILSVLVNNAGFNVYGSFEETDLEEEIKMIRLHIIAVTQMTKLFLRQRSQQAENEILNVASIAGLVPGPLVSVHFATRAYILSFSLALADEFQGSDVHVTCLCPGPTKSAFFGRANMSGVRLASGKPIKLMDAQTVAANGYEALKKRKVIVVPGYRNKILAFMAMVVPRALAIKITRWLMERI
ncbi:MAG: SDR family oxidoreductase [Gammaproteobacteria bacterium]|nr:SDR family oxidoreductase [Gammaproteobacteria bacterium]